MQVMVMLAPRKYDWGKVNLTLRKWLREVMGHKHNRKIAQERRYLVLSRPDDSDRVESWQR